MINGEISLLMDIGLILVVGTVIAFILKSLKQSPIIGYIISGVLLGPLGFSFISNQEEIMVLSELGVAFLLFTAGVELDLDRLRKVGPISVVVTLLSSSISFGMGYFFSSFFGLNFIYSIYIGLAVSFSSTMVVVKMLVDKYKLNSLEGRICLAILLVQDVIAILAISFLGNISHILHMEPMLRMALSGLGLLSIAILLSKFFFPYVLKYSADSEEIFFLISVSTCFIFIGLSSFLGFSIAIGGFIGGLALTTYPYNVEITSKVRPLRNFFTVIFFSALGMQIEITSIMGMFPLLLGLLVVLIVFKPMLMSFSLSALGYGSRIPILVGSILAQGSEFALIIINQGLSLGHISNNIYSIIITAIVISMAFSKYMFSFGDKFSRYLTKKFPEGVHISKRKVEDIERIEDSEGETLEEFNDHVALVGCHKTGREILERVDGDEVIAVDHDPDVIEDLKEEGYRCLYGEGTNKDILRSMNVKDARFLIITIPDLEDNIYVTKTAKEMNSDINIIGKARGIRDALTLYDAGADYVAIPDMLSGDDIFKKIEEFKDKDMEEFKEEEIENLKMELDDNFLI